MTATPAYLHGITQTICAVWLWTPTALLLAASSSWQPFPCVPVDPPPEALFETVQTLDDFEAAPLKWQVSQGEQNAQATLHRDATQAQSGSAALRVDYRFVGKTDYEYVQINLRGVSFDKAGTGFGFWALLDGTAFHWRLRITDRNGETHQIELPTLPRPGWQYVAAKLDSPATSWGGDGNRRRDYPCQLAGICVDRPQVGYVGNGSLWIDTVARLRPRIVSNSLQVEVQNSRFGNLYAVGDSVHLRARGEGERIRWTLSDFWGREQAAGEGSAAGTTADFKLGQPGYFACRLDLLKAGRLLESQCFHAAALTGGAEPARSDFVGVCSHFGQKAYPLETMDLMRRYGIDQFRDEISWRSYEREKGRLAMPDYGASYLQHARNLQMRPLIIFDYSNPHYDAGGFPNSTEAIAGFAAYAVDLARQTQGTVNMFEVWNEWIGGCGMRGQPGQHDGEAYGHLLKSTYQAVKRERPDVTVVGIGGEYGPNCAEHIVDAIKIAGPRSMDAWSIHPYRYPRPPEGSDLAGEVQKIARRVSNAGVSSRAWITEIGYPTHRSSRGSSLVAQANYCVRTLVLLHATRAVEKVFWYDFKDDGTDRDYNEHNFGLVHHQRYHCAPKPGVVAMSVFIRLTGGTAFGKLQREGPLCVATYSHPSHGDRLIAWTTTASRKLLVQGTITAAYDLMGTPIDLHTGFDASESPIYLIGSNLSAIPASR